jgi:hypothetical protein
MVFTFNRGVEYMLCPYRSDSDACLLKLCLAGCSFEMPDPNQIQPTPDLIHSASIRTRSHLIPLFAILQALWDVMEELLSMTSVEGKRSVRLVVNSRIGLGGGLAGADQVHLGGLPDVDAQKLLQLHAGKDAQWKLGCAAQLAEMCGGNPLALTLVGGLIAARRCTPEVGCRRVNLGTRLKVAYVPLGWAPCSM